MNRATPIAAIQEGIATVEGVVRAADAAPLRAPASERECVCYVVTTGLLTGALKQDAQPFLLQDDSGEVLVLPNRFTARLGAREKHANLDVVDADVRTVSDSLALLKDQLRKERTHELVKKRQTLRKLYTLLCAIRAHARGHCHVGKSLAGQERYIAKNSALFRSEYAPKQLRTFSLMREETILALGDRVQVTGQVEQRAHALGAAAGYRERATRLVITAPPDEPLLLVAEGAPDVEAERLLEAQFSPGSPAARQLKVVAWCVVLALVVFAWLALR